MWAYESVFYQIYPLGMCGAPFANDGVPARRILKVMDWIPHLKKLGADAVYFCPLFESDTHGYNTRDFRKVDTRLGTNEDFKKVCDALHEAGIRVILDGVFNHVGRGFFGFQDVLAKREASEYRDWFNVSFQGNSNYNDGLWYEGWEGNYDLVKLNLKNWHVCDYLIDSVRFWVDYFGIDGLRLDVAYMVDRDFLKRLRRETAAMKEDFFLAGEILHGDYKVIMNDEMCHSATNYECYKGLYSAMNSMNMFEIRHSLQRQFGPEPWTLYKGAHLFSFADNHDVSRIASILTDKKQLKPLYAMVFGMPGIPMVYYGSEWGIEGDKRQGDPALRPAVEVPEWNALTDWIAELAAARKACRALSYGAYGQKVLTNKQAVFERKDGENRVYVAVNACGEDYTARFDAGCQKLKDLLSGEILACGDGIPLPAYGARYLVPAE